VTPLAELLRRRIADAGPIPVSEYMDLALAHPRFGYYRSRDPLGRGGDFTTAPEISQIFGELIGLWCVTVWQMMGAPAQVRLVELGPGRGTLMADLLRAARMVPGFMQAATIHLVETSPALRKKQRQALPDVRPTWHDRLQDVPEGPLLVVANEFFDALPIRQYVREAGAWRERLVDVEGAAGFRFVLGPPVTPELPPAMREAPDGAVAEVCPAAVSVARHLGHRLATQGGAALIVDYGPAASACGDSLQAVRGHAFHPVLSDPGEADLTAHVDFATLALAANPARAHGPVTQARWLRRLGAELRAEQLIRANPAKAAAIASGCARLIDPAEMGTLFKVLALAHPALPTLPGFEAA
jgi:NADH dehydrogenase [ubiquinone] 1 alpha subcomplex assembly factor 7